MNNPLVTPQSDIHPIFERVPDECESLAPQINAFIEHLESRVEA